MGTWNRLSRNNAKPEGGVSLNPTDVVSRLPDQVVITVTGNDVPVTPESRTGFRYLGIRGMGALITKFHTSVLSPWVVRSTSFHDPGWVPCAQRRTDFPFCPVHNVSVDLMGTWNRLSRNNAKPEGGVSLNPTDVVSRLPDQVVITVTGNDVPVTPESRTGVRYLGIRGMGALITKFHTSVLSPWVVRSTSFHDPGWVPCAQRRKDSPFCPVHNVSVDLMGTWNRLSRNNAKPEGGVSLNPTDVVWRLPDWVVITVTGNDAPVRPESRTGFRYLGIRGMGALITKFHTSVLSPWVVRSTSFHDPGWVPFGRRRCG